MCPGRKRESKVLVSGCRFDGVVARRLPSKFARFMSRVVRKVMPSKCMGGEDKVMKRGGFSPCDLFGGRRLVFTGGQFLSPSCKGAVSILGGRGYPVTKTMESRLFLKGGVTGDAHSFSCRVKKAPGGRLRGSSGVGRRAGLRS